MTKLALKKFQAPTILSLQNQKLITFPLFKIKSLSLPSPHATIAPALSQPQTLIATSQL